MERTIVAEALGKTYPGGTEAVREISLDVRNAEIFGFLGPNGAGKTTAVSVFTTLLRPTRGRAEVAGFDVVERPTAVRKRIGVVFQRSTADADLTGRENLEIAAGLYGMSRADARPRIREVLTTMDLLEAADRPVRSYSGGMQRRLEVAIGTLHEPEVLFLDEPTLGLDPQSRAGFWDYIRGLRAAGGITVFLTTHYLDEADQLCDRISVIDHGRIIASGSPSALKERTEGDLVDVAVNPSSPDLSRTLGALPGVAGVTHEDSTYHVRCTRGESLVTPIALAAHDAAAEVVGVMVRKPSLDQVFLRLTGRAYREEGEPNGAHPIARTGRSEGRR